MDDRSDPKAAFGGRLPKVSYGTSRRLRDGLARRLSHEPDGLATSKNRRLSRFYRLKRVAGSGVIAARRGNSAHLDRLWQANILGFLIQFCFKADARAKSVGPWTMSRKRDTPALDPATGKPLPDGVAHRAL
jgi:hypothetical protein